MFGQLYDQVQNACIMGNRLLKSTYIPSSTFFFLYVYNYHAQILPFAKYFQKTEKILWNFSRINSCLRSSYEIGEYFFYIYDFWNISLHSH